MAKDVFHEFERRGTRLVGILNADGPSLGSVGGPLANGTVPLLGGIPVLWPSVDTRAGRMRWAACKYGPRDPRVGFRDFSVEDAEAVADEFGIDMYSVRPQPARFFFRSPAWDALREWVARHPRIAGRFEGTGDCRAPGWVAMAREARRAA